MHAICYLEGEVPPHRQQLSDGLVLHALAGILEDREVSCCSETRNISLHCKMWVSGAGN